MIIFRKRKQQPSPGKKQEVFPLLTPFTRDQKMWMLDKLFNLGAILMLLQKRVKDLIEEIKESKEEDV